MTAPPGKRREHCNTQGANSHCSANHVIEKAATAMEVPYILRYIQMEDISSFRKEEDKERVAGRPVGLPLVTFLQLFHNDQDVFYKGS